MDKRSEKNLVGVHADLARVVREAAELSDVPFIVVEGLRTVERQKRLVAKGASKTMRSRHLTGHAIDVAVIIDGKYVTSEQPYNRISGAMKLAATKLGVSIDWGGDWRTFKDRPHYELDWKEYP